MMASCHNRYDAGIVPASVYVIGNSGYMDFVLNGFGQDAQLSVFSIFHYLLFIALLRREAIISCQKHDCAY